MSHETNPEIIATKNKLKKIYITKRVKGLKDSVAITQLSTYSMNVLINNNKKK